MKRKTPKAAKTPKSRVRFFGTEEFRFKVNSPPVQHYAGFKPTPSKSKSKLSAEVSLEEEHEDVKQQLLVREIAPRSDSATEMKKQLDEEFRRELQQELKSQGLEHDCSNIPIQEIQRRLQLADTLTVRAMFSSGIMQLCQTAGPGNLPMSSPSLDRDIKSLETQPISHAQLPKLLLLRKDAEGLVDSEQDYAHGRRVMTVDQFLEELNAETMEAELEHRGLTVPNARIEEIPGVIPADEAVTDEDKESVYRGVFVPDNLLYPKFCMAACEGVKTLKTMTIHDLRQECMCRGMMDEMDKVVAQLPPKEAKRKAPFARLLRRVFTQEYVEENLEKLSLDVMKVELGSAYEVQMERTFLELLQQQLDKLKGDPTASTSTGKRKEEKEEEKEKDSPQRAHLCVTSSKAVLFKELCNLTCLDFADADTDAGAAAVSPTPATAAATASSATSSSSSSSSSSSGDITQKCSLQKASVSASASGKCPRGNEGDGEVQKTSRRQKRRREESDDDEVNGNGNARAASTTGRVLSGDRSTKRSRRSSTGTGRFSEETTDNNSNTNTGRMSTRRTAGNCKSATAKVAVVQTRSSARLRHKNVDQDQAVQTLNFLGVD